MTFYVTYFGYGLGLVVVGWLSGVVVGFAISLIERLQGSV